MLWPTNAELRNSHCWLQTHSYSLQILTPTLPPLLAFEHRRQPPGPYMRKLFIHVSQVQKRFWHTNRWEDKKWKHPPPSVTQVHCPLCTPMHKNQATPWRQMYQKTHFTIPEYKEELNKQTHVKCIQFSVSLIELRESHVTYYHILLKFLNSTCFKKAIKEVTYTKH